MPASQHSLFCPHLLFGICALCTASHDSFLNLSPSLFPDVLCLCSEYCVCTGKFTSTSFLTAGSPRANNSLAVIRLKPSAPRMAVHQTLHCHIDRRNDCMVITDLAVFDYLFRMNHHFSGYPNFAAIFPARS